MVRQAQGERYLNRARSTLVEGCELTCKRNYMFFQNIIQQTLNLIATATKRQSIATRPRIILGLSGGPDSLFLFHVLKDLHAQQKIELIAAHLDHGWRKESGDDVAFCQALCLKHNIPFVSAKADTLAIRIKPNGSQEEIGRKLRRFFLEQTCALHHGHLITLAHHQDDQQETFFMRLIRGTSLAGIHGMNEFEPPSLLATAHQAAPYLRPLLSTSKKEILKFLDENKHLYLTDSTNESDSYLRNKIRKYVIPALQACDQRFDNNFAATVEKLKEEDEFLERLTQKTFHEIFLSDQSSGIYRGNLAKLQALDPVLQRRVILNWLITEQIPFTLSSGFINEIVRFLTSREGGQHALGTHWSLHKKQQMVWLKKET